MNIGNIVEYIDQQKIICAVVMQIKKNRLRLLTENNREVNLAVNRVSHLSTETLDTSGTRESLIRRLKQSARDRRELTQKIDIKELWELLHEEGDPIDIPTMTMFCFDPPVTADHEAAVIRTFFKDRLFFKFGKDHFIPHSPEQIEVKLRQMREVEERDQLIHTGAAWVKRMSEDKTCQDSEKPSQLINILKNYYIFEKESPTSSIAKAILAKAGAGSPEKIFQIMVKAGVWTRDENIDLEKLDIPVKFPSQVLDQSHSTAEQTADFMDDPKRLDLTKVPIITIDGQSTLDYDDAISLVKNDSGYTLGIHIIDVGYYIKHDDALDREARNRGSSIYMPDDKIPMLPQELSEGVCSLKEGELKPAISTMIRLNPFFEIIDYDVILSSIKVHTQMTYTEANLLNGENDPITTLYKAATVFREKRLKAGAVQITLPEVNVWIDENQEIGISKIDRENPSRMLVSEMMILANSLMAQFLAKHDVPGVFRSQPDPHSRLFQGIETSLFLNCMQRKQLNRARIGTKPEHHSGLGLDAYVTGTSPIRRYFDLLTQRQIRGILGYEKFYARDELQNLIQQLEIPMANAGRIQFLRRRYWLIKHLETLRGSAHEAIVLDSRRDFYTVLLTEYMLEWRVPAGGLTLKPGDMVNVTIQHADARRDQLSLFI